MQTTADRESDEQGNQDNLDERADARGNLSDLLGRIFLECDVWIIKPAHFRGRIRKNLGGVPYATKHGDALHCLIVVYGGQA